MGILNKSFLGSKYSLPETRILHAAYTNPGITPTELIPLLNIDKSYLSRMIVRLEKEKLLIKKRSAKDKRSINLFITEIGKTEFKKLNKKSDNVIGSLLENIPEPECKELVSCMSRIEEILSKA